ncbi:MAG TPA: hypothetical protein DCR26_05960 [Porphyromonadaceae bacterium]|nr:hypothetical protein [Porphyromonadaceae bacterium]
MRNFFRTGLFLAAVMSGISYASALEFAIDGIGYVTNADDATTVYIAGKQATGIPNNLVLKPEVEYEGVTYKVTRIKEGALANVKTFVNIDMSQLEIEAIPAEAFSGSSVKSVVLPQGGLVSVGDKAFFGTGLAEITVPASVTEIGASAFEGCPLSRVTLEGADEVMTVGAKAFYCDGQVTNVVTYRLTPPVFSSDDAQGFSDDSYRHGALDIRVDGDMARYSAVKSEYQAANVWHNFYIDNPTAIDVAEADSAASVRVEGNDIVAPEGSMFYSLAGVENGGVELCPGVYVVVLPGGGAVRVAIR